MARSYKYALVRVSAHPTRDERLNVGLIVLGEDELDARAPKSLGKLAAISAALDADVVRNALERLPDVDAYVRESGIVGPSERLQTLSQFSPFEFSSVGTFSAHSAEAYEEAIRGILQRLVEPEPASLKSKPKRPSPLLSVIKGALRRERILAKKGGDLTAHRVVTGLPLAEGLYADLVLKNGTMHVVETVDASSDDASLRKVITEIAVSALVLEQARIVFGEDNTSPQIVYHASASVEKAAMPSLRAAAHRGTELVNWASREDQLRFLTRLSSLAVPLEKQGKPARHKIHASTQTKLAIN